MRSGQCRGGKLWRDGGDGEGYFVIATNVSAVHRALQLQPAYT